MLKVMITNQQVARLLAACAIVSLAFDSTLVEGHFRRGRRAGNGANGRVRRGNNVARRQPNLIQAAAAAVPQIINQIVVNTDQSTAAGGCEGDKKTDCNRSDGSSGTTALSGGASSGYESASPDGAAGSGRDDATRLALLERAEMSLKDLDDAALVEVLKQRRGEKQLDVERFDSKSNSAQVASEFGANFGGSFGGSLDLGHSQDRPNEAGHRHNERAPSGYSSGSHPFSPQQPTTRPNLPTGAAHERFAPSHLVPGGQYDEYDQRREYETNGQYDHYANQYHAGQSHARRGHFGHGRDELGDLGAGDNYRGRGHHDRREHNFDYGASSPTAYRAYEDDLPLSPHYEDYRPVAGPAHQQGPNQHPACLECERFHRRGGEIERPPPSYGRPASEMGQNRVEHLGRRQADRYYEQSPPPRFGYEGPQHHSAAGASSQGNGRSATSSTGPASPWGRAR